MKRKACRLAWTWAPTRTWGSDGGVMPVSVSMRATHALALSARSGKVVALGRDSSTQASK